MPIAPGVDEKSESENDQNRGASGAKLRRAAESGLPGFDAVLSYGLVAPAGTPAPIIAKLNAAIVAALADPDTRRKLDDQGLAVLGSSPEELRVFTHDQLAKYAKLIQEMGIAAQ